MSRILEIPGSEILPSVDAILEQQGVPWAMPGREPLLAIAAAGREELAARLIGRGILAPISVPEFSALYEGRGRNDPRTPLAGIFPRAEALFLFAATCGDAVTVRIAELFAGNDFPLAVALDAAASLAADQAAGWLQERVTGQFDSSAALGYSPGYCGWHVSGQEALFAALQPGEIGLKLRDSFLMDPLKSVSGVIVIGQPEIHRFANDFAFCTACSGMECRERIASLSYRTG